MKEIANDEFVFTFDYISKNLVKSVDELILKPITVLLNMFLLAEAKDQGSKLKNEYGSKAAYRNGYKTRILYTKYGGKITLMKPQFRYFPFETKLFDRYSRVEKDLRKFICECYVSGVSTKKIKKLAKKLGIADLSRSTISRIVHDLDDEIQKYLLRQIESEITYLFIDATYFTVKEKGHYINKAALIAIGVNANGMREVLGIKIVPTESEIYWSSFIDELIARGLKGVKLVISDGHKGIRAAVSKKFEGALWQMCLVHLKRIILRKLPRQYPSDINEIINLLDKGEEQFSTVMNELTARGYKKAANVLKNFHEGIFNYMNFPDEHWKKITSTNGVERVNAEIKRRINKVGAFPNETSALRLIAAIVMNLDEEWMKGKLYLNML